MIVSVTYQQINKGVHKMKFVKYENFAAIKKYIWTENMSKKEQDLSFLFLKKIQFLFFGYTRILLSIVVHGVEIR